MRGGELLVATGLSSRTGKRPDNQDFAVIHAGSRADRITHGVLAVLADGVGGAKGGRIAAELACREWIEAYLAQPETLAPAANAQRALAPFNRWLNAMGAADPAMAGAATTFAAIVLHGRQAHALHVGDSRIWHFREGVLTQLTEDHTLSQPGLRHVLFRAVGIEPMVRLDCAVQPLAPHDRLLITSDGVHGVLSNRQLSRLLAVRGAAEADAATLTEAALAAGSDDNATAIVLDIIALPDPDWDGIAAQAADLPVLPPPRQGDVIDQFKLGQMLSDGRYSRLFRATGPDGAACVLKFPKPTLLSEHGARHAFAREAWVGARVRSSFIGENIALPPGRQTRLYVAMPFYPGETLEARLHRSPLAIAPGLTIAIGLAQGVAVLHRRGIVHRDIKPENVVLTPAGPRLLDLGAARLPQIEAALDPAIPGTPSYMAPEIYRGDAGTPASDQFALGVTLYRMFTGRYPYGEVEAFSHPRFDRPLDPAKLRPDMPGWLAQALRRSVAPNPNDRFADVAELLAILQGGSARAAPMPAFQPLIERDPVRFWQAVSALLAAALLASLALR